VLIDWELYLPEAPACFDLFHYAYQSGILLGNKGFAHIRSTLNKFFRADAGSMLQIATKTELELLEQLYLVYNITYYLHLYAAQPQWHRQVQWLLATWNDALAYWLSRRQVAGARGLLLEDLQQQLQGLDYAVLKAPDGPLSTLANGSDADICIARKDAEALWQTMSNHPLVVRAERTKRSFMQQWHLYVANGETVHIDCIWKIKRRQYVFMDTEAILLNTRYNAFGIRVPGPVDDMLYTWLFYSLNGASLPSRHVPALMALNKPEAADLLDAVNEMCDIQATQLSDLLSYRKGLNIQLSRSLRNMPFNQGVEGLLNRCQYLWDTVRSLMPRPGFVITFSGVDGAGKSTIIAEVSKGLEKECRRRVKVLRHRPSLLPIISAWRYGKTEAEQKAITTLPRQGKNKSRVGSLLRFAYYYADYLVGQLYVQVRYVMRGYVVLYDRYYFDFIHDSRRSNIDLPPSLTSLGYALLIKPRFNFFLYATADEILRRKQELDAATIEQLTRNYLGLFERLGNRYGYARYRPILNNNKSYTVASILGQLRLVL
jgi:thymidylate kinase